MDIPKHRRAFGHRVRALRKERGWAQEAFSHHIGIDRTYISGVERGIRNPTLDMVIKIARGLEVSPAELLMTIDSEDD